MIRRMKKPLPSFPLKLAWQAALMLALALAALPSRPALADSHDYASYLPENVARIDILPGWRLADGSHMAALRIQLAEDWKTYWRAPGDAGIPPSFDWQGSRNMAGVSLLWPTPKVFLTSGLQTIGYTRELILPMRIAPDRAGEEIVLKGRVAMGVCRDVCLPMEAAFEAVLAPTGEAPDSALIRAAIADMPKSASAAGLTAIACDVEPISDGMRVTARLTMPRVGPGGEQGEVAVIEPADQSIWVSPTEVTRRGNKLTLVSDLVPPSAQPFSLSRSDIRITILGGGKGVEIASCVGS